MKETNLKPSPRLLGRCCLTDFLYSKATLMLLIFMLPLVGMAQEKQPISKADKEALNQAYWNRINGQPEISAKQKQAQLVQQNEDDEMSYELLLKKLNVDEQNFLARGYSKAQIHALLLESLEPQNNSNSDDYQLLARSGGGDYCSDAVVLACGEPSDGDVFAAFASGAPVCGSSPTDGTGVWYKFTGNGFMNYIDITATSILGGANIRVFSTGDGTCAALQCASVTGQGSNSVSFMAPYEDIFYVLVSGFGPNKGTFTIERTSAGECIDAPPGDGLSPDTAWIAECGNVYTGDTSGTAATNVQGPTCSELGFTAGDINPNGLWYKINVTGDYPSGTGVSLDFVNSSYDTEVHVYEGASLTCYAWDDDFYGCCEWTSYVEFDAQPDTDYYIYVGGYSTSDANSGVYEMVVACDGVAPPPPPQVPDNDLCPDAALIDCAVGTVFGSTTLASDADNVSGSCNGVSEPLSPGVWYLIEGDNKLYNINTCGSYYDTKVFVYEGSCGNFTCVTANDDWGSSNDCTSGNFDFPQWLSDVTFNAYDGTDYYVFVTGYSTGSVGDFQLNITCENLALPPANDFCEDAEPIACGESDSGTTLLAASEPSLAFCGTDINDSPGVWYTFAGTGDYVIVDTNGSDFDTVLAVFTGSCGAFTCVDGDDLDGDGDNSQVIFQSVAGTTYYFYVSGDYGTLSGAQAGDYVINVDCVPDPCESATLITCDFSPIIGSNSGEDGSPIAPGSTTCGTSITAPGVLYELVGGDNIININTCGSNFDTKLVVYSGTCGDLQCVTGDDDESVCSDTSGESEVEFFAADGVSYYIWVSGFSNATGDFQLNFDCADVAENDLCTDAIAVGCDTTVFGGSTVASTERGTPEEGCNSVVPNEGVWYSVVGTGGDIVASTCSPGTDFDTMLVIYTGDCDNLVCVDSNDDACGAQSEVQWSTNAGETYYVYVTGFNSQRGTFDLSIDCLCAPAEGGTECVTIYDGYDPASSAELAADFLYAEAPITYAWSNGDTGETTTVYAGDGTQNYSVTMTDATGCTNSQEFFVYVVDVNCDTRGTDKVEVCHNGTTICVAPSAIEAHLQHGDALGACGTTLCDEQTPYCDSIVTSPANGAIDESITPTISWSSATGIVDGYYLTVGTTSGGNDVLDSVDVGLSLSYTFETELEYETEYFVTVSPYNTNGAATLGCSVSSFTTIEDPLPNDDCDGAIGLTVNADLNCGVVTAGTTNLATASDVPDNITGTPNNDVWFSFVATSTVHQIRIFNKTNIGGGTSSSTDMGMAVYDASSGCLALSLVDDSDPDTLLVSGLVPGTNYVVRVYGWYSSVQNVNFDICVGTPPPPPANDECAGAVALTVNAPGSECAVVYSADHSSATDSPGGPSCDAFDNIDTWYTFVAPASGIVEVSATTGSQSGSPGWALYDSCGGTQLECINNTSAPQILSGLTAGTTYTLYVFFDTFSTEGTFDICINAIAAGTYCPSVSNNPNSEWISQVALNTINNSSGSQAYSDFTAISTDLTAGSSYTITLTPGYSGTLWTEYFSVWIDYNQDADFDDAGENVYNSSGTTSSVSSSITVPASALSGSTRMRVIMKYGSAPTGPCESGYGFGETEDYTVNIVSGARPEGNIKSSTPVDWSMAPNPTRGNVTLDLTNYLQSDVSIEVMNVTGKVIFNTSLKNLQGSKYDVELNNSLPAGMYFVRVAANGEVSTKKLMIMR